MDWTPERVANLKKWWLEGKSASQIVKLLGTGCSRSAVCGKVFRLRETGELTPIRDKAQRHTARGPSKPARPRGRPPKPVPLAAMTFGAHFSPVPIAPTLIAFDDATPGMVTSLLDLKDGHCRWPIGDGAALTFCGHPKHGRAYCASHQAIGVRQTVSASELARSIRRYL